MPQHVSNDQKQSCDHDNPGDPAPGVLIPGGYDRGIVGRLMKRGSGGISNLESAMASSVKAMTYPPGS